MNTFSRRHFFQLGLFGAVSVGIPDLLMPPGLAPTEKTDDLDHYKEHLEVSEKIKSGGAWAATEFVDQGPFYIAGAPYRAKLSPPLAEGTVLVVKGRVWDFKTRKPVPMALLDVWQADAGGVYDFENNDERQPPKEGMTRNRARLMTDESGYYEFETIHPGAYQIGPTRWRPSHIHYWIKHPNYKELVTQLFFKGDKYQQGDFAWRESLMIDLHKQSIRGATLETGTFDIILEPK